MYSITAEKYGIHLVFSGRIDSEEMRVWFDESREFLKTIKGTFGVFVDMRKLEVIPPDAIRTMIEGQRHYRISGMMRSAVIMKNYSIMNQFISIAKESGIAPGERYLMETDGDRTDEALSWIVNGIEPRKNDE